MPCEYVYYFSLFFFWVLFIDLWEFFLRTLCVEFVFCLCLQCYFCFFALQKFFDLMLLGLYSEFYFKKSSPLQKKLKQNYFPCFHLILLQVNFLKFKSLISDFLLAEGMRYSSIFLQMTIQWYQHHLLNKPTHSECFEMLPLSFTNSLSRFWSIAKIYIVL